MRVSRMPKALVLATGVVGLEVAASARGTVGTVT